MKALGRILVAALAVLATAGTPALAQETTAPAQNESIGNPQLRNFSINGTVTVPAPAPVQAAPRSTTDQGGQITTARPSQPNREQARAASSADPGPRGQNSRSSASVELPPPTPAPRVAQPVVDPLDEPAAAAQPTFAPASQAGLDVAQGEVSMLPWLIAALALAGAGAWYVLRQRPRESYAGASARTAFDSPAAAPPPVRAPPRPAPPAQPPSTGIVSTRLRPWIDLQFNPLRAVVDEGKAAVEFELSVVNSGSVPARDVLIEACLFNAGPIQDQQIRTFFDNPVAQGQRIPVIPPMQRVALKTAVILPREQVRPIEMEGRQLLVPLIAFNALYSWGRGTGQSSVSYLVGKQTKGEKLAPFRLDLGPRMFRNLAAREHELRLRK